MLHIKSILSTALALTLSQAVLAETYTCSIMKYISSSSHEKSPIFPPFIVKENGPKDPVPAPLIKADDLSWSITRTNGMIMAEVRDSTGRTLSISSTTDGQILGVQVPFALQILTCNPENAIHPMNVDPTSYGESIRRIPVTERDWQKFLERQLIDNYRKYTDSL